jgi:hypothetical protein
VSLDFVTFDLLWDKSDDPLEQFYPLKIPSNEFLHFLSDLKSFQIKFEACKIPGLIPESKLNSWVSVPKEFVKNDWWEKQKEPKNGA